MVLNIAHSMKSINCRGRWMEILHFQEFAGVSNMWMYIH